MTDTKEELTYLKKVEQKMTRFYLLLLTLIVVIVIFVSPMKGSNSKDKTEEEAKAQIKNREDKQLWSILPSHPFLIADPPLIHIEIPRKSERVDHRLPIAMARGINPQNNLPSIMLSEANLFSGLTQQNEQVPEEAKKLEPTSRTGTDISSGKPRVRSIMSPEEEEVQIGVQSRSNDDDLELDESVPSILGGASPRHYYGDAGNDESLIHSARREGSINKFVKPNDCCLFIFLDGSAFYFDDFLRKLSGFYRLMYGTVNNHPHYVSRNCKNPEEYNGTCTYIWYSGYGWVVGVGRYIGQTKGVIYTRQEETCPSGLGGWRYLNEDLEWKDNGNIYVDCAT